MSDVLTSDFQRIGYDASLPASTGRAAAHIILLGAGESTSITGADAVRAMNEFAITAGVTSHTDDPFLSKAYSSIMFKSALPDTVVEPDYERSTKTEKPYMLTPFGRNVVLPFATFVAKTCLETDTVSPVGLVAAAQTARSGVSSFEARRKIYSRLIGDTEPSTPMDVADATGIPYKTVRDHVTVMSVQHIIETAEGSQRRTIPTYEFTAKDSAEVAAALEKTGWRSHKSAIAQQLLHEISAGKLSDTPFDIDDFIKIIEEDPELYARCFNAIKPCDNRTRVIEVVDFFEEIEAVKPTDDPEHTLQAISLNMRPLVTNFLDKFLRIVLINDPSTVRNYQGEARELAKDPVSMGRLLNIDFERHALIERKSTAEHAEEICALFLEHGKLTIPELSSLLGVSKRATSNLLQRVSPLLPLERQRSGKSVTLSLQ